MYNTVLGLGNSTSSSSLPPSFLSSSLLLVVLGCCCWRYRNHASAFSAFCMVLVLANARRTIPIVTIVGFILLLLLLSSIKRRNKVSIKWTIPSLWIVSSLLFPVCLDDDDDDDGTIVAAAVSMMIVYVAIFGSKKQLFRSDSWCGFPVICLGVCTTQSSTCCNISEGVGSSKTLLVSVSVLLLLLLLLLLVVVVVFLLLLLRLRLLLRCCCCCCWCVFFKYCLVQAFHCFNIAWINEISMTRKSSPSSLPYLKNRFVSVIVLLLVLLLL